MDQPISTTPTAPPTADQTPPQPRSGLAGALDKFIGPGASPAEIWLQFGAAGLAAALVAAWSILRTPWPWWQVLVAALLALDMTGGVVTNATNAAKRWYHRPDQTRGKHLFFAAIHAAQLGLVAWLFREGDIEFFLGAYGVLMVGSCLIVFSPRYLQRPVAMVCYLGGLGCCLYWFGLTPGLMWFGPVFYLKLFVSHLLAEGRG